MSDVTEIFVLIYRAHSVRKVTSQKKQTICLTSLEMLSTLEWTKNDLKHPLKYLFRTEKGGANLPKI